VDERLSGWEDRLRLELDASVRDVRAGEDLFVSARAGGRRRVRRRRALLTLPAAVAVVGSAVWAGAGVGRQGQPQQVSPAAGSTMAPAPSAEPLDEDEAVTVFLASYTYEDAVALGEVWNVDSWEAKVRGGQALEDGETLPIPR
jgi:hypothetical protein